MIDKYLDALNELKFETIEVNKVLNLNVEIRQKSQILALNEICKILEFSSDVPFSLLSLTDLDESIKLIISVSQHG